MNIIFMGTPDFAVPVLEKLYRAHDVSAVFTAPSSKAGRSQKLKHTPVHECAVDLGIPLYHPTSLKTDEVASVIKHLNPEVIVVAAYGLFIPSNILEYPRLGCWNIHPSLLPKLRGASTVVTSILNRDATTVVSVIRLDANMDSGPILSQRSYQVDFTETAHSLSMDLFNLGGSILIETLQTVEERGSVLLVEQTHSDATYTTKQSKQDGLINWSSTSLEIEAQIRAFTPWPGSYTHWNTKTLKILEAASSSDTSNALGPIGSVITDPDRNMKIVTSSGLLQVNILQLEGKKSMTTTQFLLGYPQIIGSQLS